jgi:hypothetical protein
MEAGRPAEALAAFRASLEISPHRFFGLYGAARAARQSRKDDLARDYYGQLVSMVGPEAQSAELSEARAFLAANKSAAR